MNVSFSQHTLHGFVICVKLVIEITKFNSCECSYVKLMFLILYFHFILIVIFVTSEYSSTENYVLWFTGRWCLRNSVWIKYKGVKTVIKIGAIS